MMDTHSFDPFPVLHTPRLILRRPCDADAAALLPMRSDPEVMRYIPRPIAKSEDDVRALLHMMGEALQKGERINWAMEWRESGEAIGLIGYVDILPEHRRAEVGYSLRRDYHRRGIMREALAAVVDYGFERMHLHTILAITDADNNASGKLLESAGFREEGRFREDCYYNGAFRNSVYYGLMRTDNRRTGNGSSVTNEPA
ncbi:GNAT family N-acetyltransferase [Melittangium boletus]|uniref:Acetyltransferase ribosomal protein N-acetylase n=1 Tax=Melittangium boletus DSM 14713 TaxID=1294270 RepID=A0A250IM06_9BACT|nr:GNAT family N-acetyltransferase [Melittangium boletus]ATB31986.1 acetyltransferase ribosomal protein N-acetylase [Melittangium boletus DSM 14713]